ncbi:NAD(P)/FAD-dependent oxidoreductase [Helicobacter sp. T3_23-1059]
MKKILLLGAGYANMSLLTRLDDELLQKAEWILVSKEPYHYKSICLHDVASGKHDKSVLFNLDSTLPSKINIIQDEITSIQPHIAQGQKASYEYDYLVVGLGFESDDFGIKGVREYAKAITSYKSAKQIYETINQKLEDCRDKKGKANLSFAVCGGGFSGIEFVASLAEEVRQKCLDFCIDFNNIKIYCIEAAPKILGMFGEDLQKEGLKKLQSLGVEVLTSSKILECKQDAIIISKDEQKSEIKADVIIWTAGVKGNPVIDNSPLFSEVIKARSRVEIDEYLRPKLTQIAQTQAESLAKPNTATTNADNKIQTPSNQAQSTNKLDSPLPQVAVLENVFVLGDCSSFRNNPNDRFFPPTAQLAREQGKYLAQSFKILLKKKTQKKLSKNKTPYGKKILPFLFSPKGSICSFGERYALGNLGAFGIKGYLASTLKKIIEYLWNLQLKGISF